MNYKEFQCIDCGAKWNNRICRDKECPICTGKECPECESHIVVLALKEPNPENDEFRCERCNNIKDIENSVRVGKALICSDCDILRSAMAVYTCVRVTCQNYNTEVMAVPPNFCPKSRPRCRYCGRPLEYLKTIKERVDV
jgi:hypothetical protein